MNANDRFYEANKTFMDQEERIKLLAADREHFKMCFFNAQSLVIRDLCPESDQEKMKEDLINELAGLSGGKL